MWLCLENEAQDPPTKFYSLSSSLVLYFNFSTFIHHQPTFLSHSFQMPSQSSATTLRKRAGSPSRDTSTQQTDVTSSRNANKEQLKTSRSPIELISDHPAIMPVAPPSKSKALGAADSTTTSSSTSLSPSVAHRILHILLKPFYFLLFVILHLGHELVISARSMKAYVQVFFLPHIFPTSPGVVRVLRKDLGTDLTKKPQHLAVILPAASLSEEEEEEWHSRVSQLAQWSVASGIKCLSIMRTDCKFVSPLRSGLTL